MRSLWKGNIAFGLITIPIRLYKATESKDLPFHQYHKEDMGPVRYKKVCEICQKELHQEDIVMGYEITPGQVILLEESDLASISGMDPHTIEILGFVLLSDVDPVYFKAAYYIEPQEGSQKPYALLRAAMVESRLAGLCRLMFRRKDVLALIRPRSQAGLFLETLHDADEIRVPEGLRLDSAVQLTEKEMELARVLVSSLLEKFEPEKQADQYREKLHKLIAHKKLELPVTAVSPERGGVIDLMDALRASIAEVEASHEPVKTDARKKRSKAL